jgi:hypothetical protein
MRPIFVKRKSRCQLQKKEIEALLFEPAEDGFRQRSHCLCSDVA